MIRSVLGGRTLSPLGVGAGAAARILTFTSTASTITPSITLSAGAPAPQWTVTESNGTQYTYNTAGFTHNRVVAGNMRIELARAVYSYVTLINLNGDGLTGIYTAADLALTPNLQLLFMYSNAALVCNFLLADLPARMVYLHLNSTSSVITGSLADLPASMTQLFLHSTSSVITGSLANLPASMVYLSLYSTSSVITGSLANLPASMVYLHLSSTSSVITGSLANMSVGMTQLYLYNTSSTITGGATAMAARGIVDIRIYSTVMTQSQVDDVIARLYADRATFTYAGASLLLQIGGTNPAPSGVYQNTTPPITGKEKIYKLVVNPDAEVRKLWAITYTA